MKFSAESFPLQSLCTHLEQLQQRNHISLSRPNCPHTAQRLSSSIICPLRYLPLFPCRGFLFSSSISLVLKVFLLTDFPFARFFPFTFLPLLLFSGSLLSFRFLLFSFSSNCPFNAMLLKWLNAVSLLFFSFLLFSVEQDSILSEYAVMCSVWVDH